MITNNGQVKVMDFGIARALADSSATMTHTNAVMGTAQYLSPEQARGEVVDARSDIYSTGCLLYELLTGQAPFVGDSPMAIAFQHVSAEPVAPSSVNPSVPMRFDTLVLKSLAKSPENRYTTAADMRADVNRLLAGEAATAQLAAAKLDETQRIQPITTKDSTMARSNKPKKAALISAAIAVTAVVIGALVLVSRLISPGEVAQVNVPDLAGLTLDRAAVVLSNAGLTIGETTYQNSDDRPANTIISQNPIPDALVDKGTAVSVIVSKGKDQVPVPTLVNLASQDEARLALEAVGLFLGEVTIEDNEAPLGTVLRSDPPAGTYVVAESRVSIVVSSGKITVPNVIGLTEADARDELFNLGFLVNVVYSEIDTVAPGLVMDQSPKADKLLAVGRTITLTVSQLPVDPSETIADPNATP
jgi:serine/threonine-protein kinase